MWNGGLMMKQNRKGRKWIVLAIICILFVSIFLFYKEREAEAATKVKVRDLHVNAYMKNEIQVKIGWRKKNVTKYVIYRANVKANGTIGTYKRIGDVSGQKTYFLDKISDMDLEELWQSGKELEGKRYAYKVCGYKKIGGKYQKVYEGKRLLYTGLWQVMWDEYQHCDAKITPTSIPLTLYGENEFKPEYYRIYRSENGKDFKVLTEIKSKKYGVTYVDENVETGKSYYYKARAYRMAGKEKIFSDYTDIIKHSAVNRSGIFSYEVLTPVNEKTSELVMKLSSDEKNGDLVFEAGLGWNSLSYCTEDDYEGEPMDIAMDIVAYSYDNENWTDFIIREQKLVVKSDETIYLKFSTRNGIEFTYLDANDNVTTMQYEEVRYNGLRSSLQFGQGGGAGAQILSEYYH